MENPGKQDLISVIIPVYNLMAYLPRCVASVRAQTYTALEILLVDDGSTDGSAQLCDDMAAEDDRIRVLHKENGGSSSARNAGLALATGAYIGFVDGDDYIDPQMYALLLQGLKTYGTRVAQIGRDEIDEQGRRLPDICVPPESAERIPPREFLKELLLHRGDCSFCTKLFAAEVLRGKRFPEGTLNEDFHFLVELLPQLGEIVSLPQQTYHVFYRMGSNSRKKDKDQFSRVYTDNVNNADLVLRGIDPADRELERIAFRFGVFQRLDYLLHIPIRRMTGKNTFYRRVVRDLRRGYIRAMANPYLTVKNKVYLTLFVIAPRIVREVHRKLKGFDK